MKIGFKTILLGSVLSMLSQHSMAQMNNKPFQFKNSIGGIGMSDAGKQAIINESMFGYTPDNISRGLNGELLTVEKGKGNTPIVRYSGTNNILASYKGSGFSNNNQAMKVGVFNAFFTQDSGGSSSYASGASEFRYNSINTWTGRVAAEGTILEHAYMGSGQNTIDAWTGQVMVLADY